MLGFEDFDFGVFSPDFSVPWAFSACPPSLGVATLLSSADRFDTAGDAASLNQKPTFIAYFVGSEA
jgi:hypothetical protein